MSITDTSLVVHFFFRNKPLLFAYRRMYAAPRVGDICVFNETRYAVDGVEWCLDEDATDVGTRLNIELKALAQPTTTLRGGNPS